MDWWRFEKHSLMDFDRKARPKTFKALVRVVQLIPDEVFESKLRNTLIHVPDGILGMAFSSEGFSDFVYLDDSLEANSQKEADFTVAHELAHIVLGHTVDVAPQNEKNLPWEECPREDAANKLAESWGLPNPRPRFRGR